MLLWGVQSNNLAWTVPVKFWDGSSWNMNAPSIVTKLLFPLAEKHSCSSFLYFPRVGRQWTHLIIFFAPKAEGNDQLSNPSNRFIMLKWVCDRIVFYIAILLEFVSSLFAWCGSSVLTVSQPYKRQWNLPSRCTKYGTITVILLNNCMQTYSQVRVHRITVLQCMHFYIGGSLHWVQWESWYRNSYRSFTGSLTYWGVRPTECSGVAFGETNRTWKTKSTDWQCLNRTNYNSTVGQTCHWVQWNVES